MLFINRVLKSNYQLAPLKVKYKMHVYSVTYCKLEYRSLNSCSDT